MPELPDITVYIEALERRILGRPVERIALRSAFVLRTVEPPITEAEGRTVAGLRRLGKRIVLDLGDGLFLAIHLMIAGRLRWLARGAKGPGRITLASFDFPGGTLVLTEAGTRRRAAMHLVRGEAALRGLDRGGIDVLAATRETFAMGVRAGGHQPQAGAPRSPAVQRHRQRLLRRDPPRRPALPARAHRATDRHRGGATPRGVP